MNDAPTHPWEGICSRDDYLHAQELAVELLATYPPPEWPDLGPVERAEVVETLTLQVLAEAAQQ